MRTSLVHIRCLWSYFWSKTESCCQTKAKPKWTVRRTIPGGRVQVTSPAVYPSESQLILPDVCRLTNSNDRQILLSSLHPSILKSKNDCVIQVVPLSSVKSSAFLTPLLFVPPLYGRRTSYGQQLQSHHKPQYASHSNSCYQTHIIF